MKKVILLGAGVLLSLTACKKESTESVVGEPSDVDSIESVEPTTETEAKTLSLTLNAASDSNLSGTINLEDTGEEVKMVVNVAGITPGEHAIHIHETGDCSAPDASSAGGHWNPTSHEHGKFDSDAFHMGDIGNLTADEDGNASLEFSTDKWCIGCDDEAKNIVGKAIIIHEGVDDFTTQPTGNAGGRIGCVEIK